MLECTVHKVTTGL